MAQRNTTTLVDLIKDGRMNMSELTRKERKAVEKSMSVTKEQREYQKQTQINQNQHMYEKPKPKNVVKAEKVGWDWGFSQKGFRHFVDEIESTFFGKTKEFDGYLIYKANDNEAVLYQQ